VGWRSAAVLVEIRVNRLTGGAKLAFEAIYLRRHPEGKLLHDLLAAVAVIDNRAFTWAEVEALYGGGQWSARAACGTNTFITIAANREHALKVLFAPALCTPADGKPCAGAASQWH
jgi:hypothetical protein